MAKFANLETKHKISSTWENDLFIVLLAFPEKKFKGRPCNQMLVVL